ncbi:MAG TPA: DUF4271 domain-containing protein [Bacteroidales bacterium]|nr:DUF4271 domain-containing protein [Bacteroidales bacterium]
MLQDSLTYSVNSLPGENGSLFKNFVRSQDEVPEAFRKTFFVGNSKDNYPQFYIKQAAARSDTSNCTSVFHTGQKHITDIRPKEIPDNQSDLYFYLLMFCFVVGTMILFVKQKRLSQIFKAFYLPHFTNQLMREGLVQKEFYAFPMFLIYYISLSMLIAKSVNYFYKINTDFYFVLLILGVLIIIFILRSLLITLLKWTFKTYTETSEYNNHNFIFSIISGIFLAPMVFLIYYLQNPFSNIILCAVLIIMALLLLYRTVRSFLVGMSFEKSNLFYFILYLCTIEILPLVITIKLLIDFKLD